MYITITFIPCLELAVFFEAVMLILLVWIIIYRLAVSQCTLIPGLKLIL